MSKKLLVILECILILALLTGCWSRKEPKNMSMVNSILYDLSPSGETQVMIEVMHPTGEGKKAGGSTGDTGSGDGASAPMPLVFEGKTVAEALRNLSKNQDKELFGGLNQARIFSEKLCKQGVGPILDFFARDHMTDETPLMVVVNDDNPKRIYTCSTGMSDMLGNYLSSLSDTQQKITCEAVFVTSLQFFKDYYTDGQQPVMGLVRIEENTESTNGDQDQPQKPYIIYEGLAAFKDDKLVGYMNGIETRDYNMLTNNFKITAISVPYGNDFIAAIIKKANSKINTELQNEQIKINIKIKAVLTIIQEYGSIDISQREVIKQVEQEFNEFLKSEIEKTIKKAQNEFKSDIFGFGRFFHAQHPKEWQKIQENWDEIFSKAQVSVNVESSIIMEGEIKIPFTMEKKVNDK
ncbi:MAG: Ger(x)C family spore germination protein [Clostridia bacterium]|nr:Ger(x)C family spore germination protein [Clostridia bacterium]